MDDPSRVLYICQNPSGMDTIELLAEKFTDITFYCVTCNNLFNQSVSIPSAKNIHPILLSIPELKTGFYGLSNLSRLRRIRQAYRVFKKIKLPNFDLIIYNNDGAFQRMISSNFGCKKVMLLDGVLSGNEHSLNVADLKTKLLKFVYRIFPENKNFYLPSILGISNPDRILVITKHCRAYLQKNSIDVNKISVIGFSRLNIENQTVPNKADLRISRVVFVAQSFLWHGLQKFNCAMLLEIKFWKKVCLEMGLHFAVKPHPRNSKSDFNDLKEEIVFTSESDNIDPCTLYIGMSSTYILERHKLGYGILITRSSNFFKTVDNMFYSSEFPIVENEAQATYFLNNLHLCVINRFEKDYTFGPDILYEEFKSLL